jgi:hypothetical protein
MPELNAAAYHRKVEALLDQEVAELEVMRARFAAIGTPPTDTMAKVCNFASERVQLLRSRIGLAAHDPGVRR